MSRSSRPRRPWRGRLTHRHRLPWYAACILVPVTLGWTAQQILLLTPIIILILILVPHHARAHA
ncbi:hypothetical protein [Catellatospora chokoriensis]|uniref:hypothetical protein n=1 Tax=Catellatospora chokoriensis TaxID=310353 RepID=UPI00177E9F18|nr:hypothetical protein [Catellatospora chokoriensis]